MIMIPGLDEVSPHTVVLPASARRSPDCDLLDSQRLLWYSQNVDPLCPRSCRSGRAYDSSELRPPTPALPYNLISSLCEDGLHRPALDIDWCPDDFSKAMDRVVDELRLAHVRIEAEDVVLEPSTSNWHAYVPGVAMQDDEYATLMKRLADKDFLEPGYVRASIARQQSCLRPSHVPKI